MLTIKVDISVDLDAYTEKARGHLARAMINLQDEGYDYWKRLAMPPRLKFSQRDYHNAIQAKRISEFDVMIYLDPDVWLPNALETGWPTFWMWKGLLASRHGYYFSARAEKLGGMYKADWESILKKVPQYGRFWERPPFFDVPFKNAPQGEAVSYARMSRRTTMKFRHPGFRPKGTGGLKRPLREFVVEHLVESAPNFINEALSRVKV